MSMKISVKLEGVAEELSNNRYGKLGDLINGGSSNEKSFALHVAMHANEIIISFRMKPRHSSK